jgi:hypothetical protein
MFKFVFDPFFFVLFCMCRTAYVASGTALSRPGAYDITDAFGI